MKITLKQLEVFVEVAKTGNMTAATERLFLTQSACSMSLSALESQLSGDLFDRHGKKLVLNDRGRLLFPKAANILAQVYEIQDLYTGKSKAELAGHLNVGASSTIGNYLLPKFIGHFIKTFPNTTFTLKIGNTEQIIKKVLQFEVDIGLIEGDCFENKIEVLPWKKDDLIIVAASHHPLAKKRKITMDHLHQQQWILRESGSGIRQLFEAATNKKISAFLEFSNTEAIKQAVLVGLGISCLSKTAVSDLLTQKQLVQLTAPFLKLSRDFSIVIHKEKYKTLVLKQFITACHTFA